MSYYLLLVLAVVPGLLISYLIFRIDKYEQEPWWALALCFALGGAATVPAQATRSSRSAILWDLIGAGSARTYINVATRCLTFDSCYVD